MHATSCIQAIHLKGAQDNFSLIPIFFFKKSLDFYNIEVYIYVVTAFLILLAASSQLQRYMHFLSVAIFKSQL